MNIYEEILFFSALQTAIKDRVNDLRVVAQKELDAGDQKRPSVNGLKLGSVSLSVADGKAVVVDQDALIDWLPDESVSDYQTFDMSDEAEILPILADHAPHLLRTVLEIDKDALNDALNRVAKGEDIPGVEVKQGGSTLTVRASKDAKVRAFEALERGVLSIEAGA